MAEDNVVRFPGMTRKEIDPDELLSAALGKMEGVIIAGYTKDGIEYYASSYSDGGEIMWLVERFKHMLMQIVDED